MKNVPKQDGIKFYFNSRNRKIYLMLERFSENHVIGYAVKRVFAVSDVSRIILVILCSLYFH